MRALRSLISAWAVVTATGFLYPAVYPKKQSSLHLFDKLFERNGLLGKGLTVGKVQVALRLPGSIESKNIFPDVLAANVSEGSRLHKPDELAQFANEVCLGLLRKSSHWVAACSTSQWFREREHGSAERFFNDLVNVEASKSDEWAFDARSSTSTNPPEQHQQPGDSMVVVSLVMEIQGDQTRFQGAGLSLTETKDVLSSIASDCVIGQGAYLNAVEVLVFSADRFSVEKDLFFAFPELNAL